MHATPSTSDQREKVVELTPKAIEFVTARKRAAGELDRVIRDRVGDAGLGELYKALGAINKARRRGRGIRSRQPLSVTQPVVSLASRRKSTRTPGGF